MNLRQRRKNFRRMLRPALALASALALCYCFGSCFAAGAEETDGARPEKQASAEAASAQEAGQENEALPARFCLADQGRKPQVRSQGNTGTCWAICAGSAM